MRRLLPLAILPAAALAGSAGDDRGLAPLYAGPSCGVCADPPAREAVPAP